MSFLLLPSVDVKDGRCVRLFQGDYQRETIFNDDPLDAVGRWFEEGADYVHVVDLNAARGDPDVNRDVMRGMLTTFAGKLELGGGIRTVERAGELIESGAFRVVFGTAAVREPGVCVEACKRWPDSVAVGLDARKGRIAVQGWTEQTSLSAVDLATRFASEGVQWIIYTDIERDATLTSPNFEALRELIEAVPAATKVVASGGVSSIDHIVRARDVGASGAIVGMALFDGRVKLPNALAALWAPIASHGS